MKNTTLECMGLFAGYDAGDNRRRLSATREEAEARAAAWLAKWPDRPAPAIRTVREDMAGEPLYFRAGSLFERFGFCGDIAAGRESRR
jgi:hypothetical protein